MKTNCHRRSRLCRQPRLKALSRAGYLPVTFDNLERGHKRAVKWGPLERGDLRNDNDLARAFEAHRPWAVMHFAAYAYVGESSAEPAKCYDNNIGGSGGAGLGALGRSGAWGFVCDLPHLWTGVLFDIPQRRQDRMEQLPIRRSHTSLVDLEYLLNSFNLVS